MVEYLDGGRIQGSSTLTSSPPQTSWKELDRVTLSSTADELDTSTFTTKDNIMLLTHRPSGSGNVTGKITYNGDTGSNYAIRWSDNGAADGSGGSRSNLDAYYGQGNDEFGIHKIINISSQEKLGINHIVESNSSGAGNAPSRYEIINKWANTSAQINRIQFTNTGTGDFSSGTEVVVLGCDNDEADTGSNFWQELANVESSATDDTITTGTISAKKYLMVDFYATYTGDTNSVMVFNSDTGSNYSQRNSFSGGADGTNTSRANFTFADSSVKNWIRSKVFIVNKSDKEKLYIVHQMNGNDGAGNAPARAEQVGKWANTSDSITNITMNQSNSGSFTYKHLQVFGAD